jgi:hypothetical protein
VNLVHKGKPKGNGPDFEPARVGRLQHLCKREWVGVDTERHVYLKVLTLGLPLLRHGLLLPLPLFRLALVVLVLVLVVAMR